MPFSGMCPSVGCTLQWDVSFCGMYPSVGCVLQWDVSFCGMYPSVGCAFSWDVPSVGEEGGPSVSVGCAGEGGGEAFSAFGLMQKIWGCALQFDATNMKGCPRFDATNMGMWLSV